jgi:flagellar biosynthetic protein FliQ
MTPDQASEVIRSSLWLALQLSGPVLTVCLLLGLVISVFQSATLLSDQSLNFIPKLFAAAVATAALLPWMSSLLTDYAKSLIESISLTG